MNCTAAKYLCFIFALILLNSACQTVKVGEESAESNFSTTAPTETVTTAAPSMPAPTPAATASATPLPTPEPTVISTPTPTEQETFMEEGGIAASVDQPVAEIVSGTVRSLYAGSKNSVWIVTDDAAVQWHAEGVRQTLPSLPGRFIGEDTANGRIWAVTPDHEMMAWDGNAWQIYGPENGWALPDNEPAYTYPGVVDANGRFWVSTNSDVRLFDGDQWLRFGPADMGLENIVDDSTWFNFTLLPAANGDVWLGVCHVQPPGPAGGQGVRLFQDGVWLPEPNLPQSGCVSAFGGDPDGSLWVNFDGDLWHRSGLEERWIQQTPPPPEFGRYGAIVNIVMDRTGGVWALSVLCGGASCGSLSTLFHIVDDVWVPVSGWEFPAFSDSALFMGETGELWVAADRKLYQVATAGTPAVTGTRPIYAATQTEDGRLYFVADDAAGQATLFSLR